MPESTACAKARKRRRECGARRMELDSYCGVCYVCHEPCAARSRCVCAAHVHEDCLTKTAVACNTNQCTICKTRIDNLKLVKVAHSTRVREVNTATEAVVLCLLSLVFSLLSMLFFAATTEQLEKHAYAYAGYCLTSLALAIYTSHMLSERADAIAFEGTMTVAVLL